MSFNKYKNKKCTCRSGHVHDSRKEACRCNELNLMLRAKCITDLRYQVKYILIPSQYEESDEYYTKGAKKGQKKPGKLIEKECAYYADFVYNEGGKTIVEDTKGVKTKDYLIKRKLMLWVHNVRIQEI